MMGTVTKAISKSMTIDWNLVVLNATSVTSLGMSWISENLDNPGVTILLVSISFLNFAKGVRILRPSKNKKSEG